VALVCALSAATAVPASAAAGTNTIPTTTPYVPGEIIVGYAGPPTAHLQSEIAGRTGATAASPAEPDFQVLRLPRGETVAEAVARLQMLPGVAYAAPDYIAHAAGWIPDDRGLTRTPGGWQLMQWNFLPAAGVDAPDAWSHLFGDGAPGGRGVTVAVLDTGVAYKDWLSPTGVRYAQAPDFAGSHFAAPCDVYREMVLDPTRTSPQRCTQPDAVDRNGHGTFVAGVVAEGTNNHIGLTGLAWGATIMPVRVLDAQGNGDSATIAMGIRYAALHGAKVINLSLEFPPGTGAGDVPDVIGAIAFAHHRGVVVVAAAGNDYAPGQPAQVTYPALDPLVISVGATTSDRCRASYSNVGPGLDLVAPGGGDDASVPNDPHCNPNANLPSINQMTYRNWAGPPPSNFTSFGFPSQVYGTSMAAPHVSAAAALVIASGTLGANPSPDQVLARLERTAQPLGTAPRPNADYGYGLLDAGAATAGVSQTARFHRRHHHRRRHHRRRRHPRAT
jgi:serine protease